ncbi:protein kinase domain-containing protein [Halomonas denitrificans]|nr:protein kinase [Halomonas denitrificans]
MADEDDARQIDTRTMTGARRMLPKGTVIAGRYRILDVLGAGGMGVVYRARDQALETDVALKVLADRLAEEPVALERFRREIRLARQITHPNVVRIHDLGTDGDLVFMTMDLVPGRTLVDRLAEGPLPADRAIAIAIQLAGALAEAHRHEIVHRDLKPSNVLIDDSGRAWLTDFGIARALDQEQLTEAGTAIGTVAYMAPEQVRGEAVDGRADLYALGLLVWEMITGRVPLKGETRDETVAGRLRPTLPNSLGGDDAVPRGVRRLLRRVLAPRPDDRPATAESFVEDLERGRSRMNWRRSLRRTAAIGLFVGAVVAAVLVLPDWMRPATPEAEAAPRVVVLPVANGTGSEAFDWARSGLSEAIAGRLAENPKLSLVEPLRVRRTLADLRLPVEDIDRERLGRVAELLGADWVIQSLLLGSPARLRLQVAIFDPAGANSTDLQLDTVPDEILSAADRAARRFVDHLRVPVERDAPLPQVSSDPGALAAFDSGIDALAGGNHQRALEALRRAVEVDPGFGRAWVRLAEAAAAAGLYDEAVAAAGTAAELLAGRGGRAEAWAEARYLALAGRTESAIERFQRLVDAYPGDADAQLALAELLADDGRIADAARWAEQVTVADANHPRAWFLLGKFAVMAGDVRRAADEYFVKALVIQNRIGDAEGRAEVLNGLGIAHERLGELDVAVDYYREAAELRAQAGDRRGHSASLSNIARLNMIRGRYELARESIEQALRIREEIGDLAGMARTYNAFGALEEEVGDYDAARGHYRDSLRLHEQLGNALAAAGLRTSLAFIHLLLGEYETAGVFVERAIEQQETAGDSQGLMSSLQIAGELAIVRGAWADAEARLLRALEIAREVGNPFGEATVHGSIGLLAGYQGRVAAAEQAYDEAIALLEPLGDRRGLAEYHLRSAEMLDSLDLLEGARARWQRAQQVFADQANLSQRARLVRMQAALAAATGDDDAPGMYDEALQLARASGSEPTALGVRISRLDRLGGSPSDYQQLVQSADRLGHAPMQLQALALHAARLADAGRYDAAGQTASRGLRPPLALEAWSGNWQLHQVLERVADGSPGAIDGPARSRELLAALAGRMPPALARSFRAMHDL